MLIDPTAAAACRERSAARHRRTARGAAGKVALPKTAKGKAAREAAHWKYWRSVVLRVKANNHRLDRLIELGLDSDGTDYIYWPEAWNFYPEFKRETLDNDEAPGRTHNGMTLVYHTSQRITSRSQTNDRLSHDNYAWYWGLGAETAAQGNGVCEFL